MQTHFSSQTLVELFRDIYLGERSGVLHLVRGEVEKRIYFDRGMILFAESGEEDEDLGPRLVGEGKISSGALAEARKNVSESKDLAQALINRGLIAKETLSHTVRFIIDRVVRTVFQWEGGTARFSEGWLLQEIFESDIVMTFEIILKGVSDMLGFEPVKEALKAQDSVLEVAKPTPVPLQHLTLSPSHGFILSRVDGSTTLANVLSILPEDEEDATCRFLYGLLVMGVLEFDPPISSGPFSIATILQEHADVMALEKMQDRAISDAYDRLRDKNPFETLGVPADAEQEEIERAYEEAKKAFHRDRFVQRVRDRRRSHLAFIESRLVEAYLSIVQSRQKSPGSRQERAPTGSGDDVTADSLMVRVEMDKTKTKMALEENTRAADAYYAKARKAMGEGDFHNAIQYGKLAISYNPEDARYFFLVADCQVRNPEARWQRLAEQNFRKATELDPWNPDYWISLGLFYKKRGLKLRAKKQFEEALRIAPAHENALAELEALG
jgi:tetratricopeptide (TPR) repeat protein